jgi:hypothetical protein
VKKQTRKRSMYVVDVKKISHLNKKNIGTAAHHTIFATGPLIPSYATVSSAKVMARVFGILKASCSSIF